MKYKCKLVFFNYLALLVADGEVLSASMRGRKHTHGNSAKHMSTDELADGLSLISAVVHPNILKSSLL